MTTSERLQSGLIEEICLVVACARALPSEPKFYGPMRLMEGIQRLVRLMQKNGVDHDVFEEVASRIEGFPLEALPEGMDEFILFMDELVFFLSSYIVGSSDAPKEETAQP